MVSPDPLHQAFLVAEISRLIHESLEYLDGRATVFHSCYLSAWANTSAEMKESVVLGHFVLPPACLQEGEGEHQVGAALSIPQYTQGYIQHEGNNIFLPQYSSEENPGSRASTQGEFSYHALKEYPMNNMVTGYTSARDMKKYVGELRDFIPGTSGYTAYWIQNEIKVYSDVKTKMKRKL
uniref:Telomere repeat binding bouquet formation protein 2 n=1 Tax=Anser cygnoides TaxID=8845 RepID=A0A8B9E9I5_ANSCY